MEVNVQINAPAVLLRAQDPGTHWLRGWVGSTAELEKR